MSVTNMSLRESRKIRFIFNDKPVSVECVDPTKSVLTYLRNELGLVGSKEGCAEGDCGACTIVVGELVGKDLQLRAINACIQFVPTLNGKALYTVEYVRQKNDELHPVQQAMVDCHGSQCGFCTPGFVMSLWCVYVNHVKNGSIATDTQLRESLSGNLCRCTGYRPILDAGKKMFELPTIQFEQSKTIGRLMNLNCDRPLRYTFKDQNYYAPLTIAQLTDFLADSPNATILAGCTDIGLWVNKQFRDLGHIVYVGRIAELKQITQSNGLLTIGAGVSLSDAFAELAQIYPEINQQWLRFASIPIRNAGTLGGNIANGSPIGDSMPWLMVLGARVTLTSKNTRRTIPLDKLYLGYMKNAIKDGEFVESIEVPIIKENLKFRTYKISKRYDSDISAVCAAFAIRMEGVKISAARIAFGGMAATPKRALLSEHAITGQQWTESTVRKGVESLLQDFEPLSDMRASAENRRQCAQNLFYRFYLETRPLNPLPTTSVSVFEAV